MDLQGVQYVCELMHIPYPAQAQRPALGDMGLKKSQKTYLLENVSGLDIGIWSLPSPRLRPGV